MAEPVRGAGQPQWPLSPYNIQVSYSSSQGITRGTGADWFGPLNPLAPIAPPDVAGRRFDYPPGYNLVTRPRAYEPVGFAELRGFAEAYDLLRIVIETRKSQIMGSRWAINPRDPKYKRKNSTIAPEMQARIDALTKFWRKPDGITPWKTWIYGVLEDLFVIDAPTLYCQRTRGGKLLALCQLDGATIKRVIDDWGRTPTPYKDQTGANVFPPAYQQVLKGLPATNYSTRDIIYRPRNVRPHKVYGYSPVQQILLTVQIALRRQMWQLDYYTEGSIPDALIGVPNTWTPDQVKQFQEYWDTEFAGDLAKRRRAKFVPGDTAAKVHQTKEPEQKNDFDEWLARITCYAFSVSPQWATKMVGRAEAQQHSENAEQEGLEPTKEWIAEFANAIIEDEFNSPDLELTWIEQDETDPGKQNEILDSKVKSGRLTINEARDNDGLDPFSDPAANKPMVLTPTGYVPIEANTIEGKQANIDAFGLPPTPGQPGEGGDSEGGENGEQGGNNAGAKGKPAGDSAEQAKKARYDAAIACVRLRLGTAKTLDEQADATASLTRMIRGEEPIPGFDDRLNGSIPFGKRAERGRRSAPVPFDRPLVRGRIKLMAAVLAKTFSKLEPKVIAAVRDELGKVSKDKKGKAKAQAQAIVDDLDFSLLVDATGDVADDLSSITTDSGQMALAQLGVDDRSDLVDQVNDRAVAMAESQAATMVSGIDERTRNMLRDLIAGGLDNNIGTDAIAEAISDSGLFSDDRADLIARTEIADANSAGALAGYKAARDDAGVKVRKAWGLGPNPCEICQENADEGDIDLDDEFPSGDDAPTAHPRCECDLVPVVED